jgi:DNA-binding response OmpR family regulator
MKRIPSLAHRSILIVEDEPLVALGVHTMLSSAGASIISASTTGEAKELIAYAEVSAAIVDVQLGDKDASEICRLLNRRRIPFLFYTGNRSASLLKEWLDVPVLSKPSSPHALVCAIASMLDASVT